MSKISLKDIALKSGVSVGTVDRVIHNRGKVSEEAKERVLEAIKQLNYSPNLVARSLARKENFRIAALIPTKGKDPFWQQPLNGIKKAESFIKDFGFTVDIFPFDDYIADDLLKVGRQIFDKEYSAVLIAPIIRDESLLFFKECEDREIPYVQINTFIERENPFFLCYVGQDSYSSGTLAAKLLNFGVQKNDTLLILHLEKEVYNSQHLLEKEKGFRDYFKHNQINHINVEQLSFSDIFNDDKRKNFIKSTLKMHPNIAGVFVSSSKLHKVLPDFIRYSEKELKFVGFDLIEDNLNYLEKDQINFLINQNPSQQGYLAIINIFNHLLKKSAVKNIQYLPLDVVMKENVAYYLDDSKLNVSYVIS